MDIQHYMTDIGRAARKASRAMAKADTSAKNRALELIAAAIRIEHNLCAIGRIAGADIKRTTAGKLPFATARQIHRIDIGIATTHGGKHHGTAIGGEARGKRHARKIAQHLLAARIQIKQDNARLFAALIGHEGHAIRRRMETRRQRRFASIGQEGVVFAILIHDR